MNLNAYDNITEKINKSKTWIDVKKHLLLSREIKYRKFYILSKRFNVENSVYNYFIILLDYQPENKVFYYTKRDDYGRIKIRLHELYNESDLKYFEKDSNIIINHIEHEEDGDVYQLEI